MSLADVSTDCYTIIENFWGKTLKVCTIFKIWKRVFLSNGCLFVPDLRHFTWTPTSAFLFTFERKIRFSPNCSSFAVERNWYKKNHPNVQKLLFSEIQIDSPQDKTLKFSKVAIWDEFFQQCASIGIVISYNVISLYLSCFWQEVKERKNLKLEKFCKVTKKQSTSKKSIYPSKRQLFELGGRKISRR